MIKGKRAEATKDLQFRIRNRYFMLFDLLESISVKKINSFKNNCIS